MVVRMLSALLGLMILSPSAQAACQQREFALNVPFLIKKMNGDLCWNQNASLIADLDNRVMFVCLEKKTVKAYPFAYGSEGFPKYREDDGKTPVGSYRLAAPRSSNSGFHTFIEIGYPTISQRDRGLTGSAVGIHGPDRSEMCDGLKSVETNWTDGCLALPSDPAISSIAAFVREHPQAPVHIYTRKKLK